MEQHKIAGLADASKDIPIILSRKIDNLEATEVTKLAEPTQPSNEPADQLPQIFEHSKSSQSMSVDLPRENLVIHEE